MSEEREDLCPLCEGLHPHPGAPHSIDGLVRHIERLQKKLEAATFDSAFTGAAMKAGFKMADQIKEKDAEIARLKVRIAELGNYADE